MNNSLVVKTNKILQLIILYKIQALLKFKIMLILFKAL